MSDPLSTARTSAATLRFVPNTGVEPMPPADRTATVTSLHVYPVKSCAGTTLSRARLTATGFEHDRQWMLVRPNGRFVTQRELPRLALIRPMLVDGTLQLHAPNLEMMSIAVEHDGRSMKAVVWRDECKAIDAGDGVASWLGEFLGEPLRLVRFDPTFRRMSDPAWTKGTQAFAQFADAFPWLLISQASLDALNARLEQPLPMNRFRPNIVVEGLEPFEEDLVESLGNERVMLHPVKPCTRCAIITTDQVSGERQGDEPLRTLRAFRFNAQLRGVTFGQNLVLTQGIGEWLEVGEALRVVGPK